MVEIGHRPIGKFFIFIFFPRSCTPPYRHSFLKIALVCFLYVCVDTYIYNIYICIYIYIYYMYVCMTISPYACTRHPFRLGRLGLPINRGAQHFRQNWITVHGQNQRYALSVSMSVAVGLISSVLGLFLGLFWHLCVPHRDWGLRQAPKNCGIEWYRGGYAPLSPAAGQRNRHFWNWHAPGHVSEPAGTGMRV